MYSTFLVILFYKIYFVVFQSMFHTLFLLWWIETVYKIFISMTENLFLKLFITKDQNKFSKNQLTVILLVLDFPRKFMSFFISGILRYTSSIYHF